MAPPGLSSRSWLPSALMQGRRIIILAAPALVGCGGPSIEPGFESVDPQERTAALLDAARSGDASATPELVIMLDSSDPAERMLADETLRRLTGEDFGYRHYDPEPQRREAAKAWRQWWEQGEQAAPLAQRPSSGGDGASETP